MRWLALALTLWLAAGPAHALENVTAATPDKNAPDMMVRTKVSPAKELSKSLLMLNAPSSVAGQGESYINNQYFNYVGGNYLFERREHVKIQSPLDGGDTKETSVYRLEQNDTLMNLPAKPIFSFNGNETLVQNSSAMPYSASDDSLLIVEAIFCCSSRNDEVYRLKNGEKLFDRSFDIGEIPANSFVVYKDNNDHWLLISSTIKRPESPTKPLELTLKLSNATTSRSYEYSLPLAPDTYKKCMEKELECGIVFTPSSDENKTTIAYGESGTQIQLGLSKDTKTSTPLLTFTLSEALEVTADQKTVKAKE